jgi:hypothetical protein
MVRGPVSNSKYCWFTMGSNYNNFILFQINFFLVFLYYFDVLMWKINFKKYKKYYFNIFLNKKYFKK